MTILPPRVRHAPAFTSTTIVIPLKNLPPKDPAALAAGCGVNQICFAAQATSRGECCPCFFFRLGHRQPENLPAAITLVSLHLKHFGAAKVFCLTSRHCLLPFLLPLCTGFAAKQPSFRHELPALVKLAVYFAGKSA
jgi:hypothetical protein